MSAKDPMQEQMDPDPKVDLQILFNYLNQLFFVGYLHSVHVAWSPRLRVRGGYCRFNPDTQYCRIRINEHIRLTKPRIDLVKVLLHEMIHALLFVFHQRDDASHGTLFCKFAEQIKQQSGIEIPIVWDVTQDEIRQHQWLCNGPCHLAIKRAINRLPSRRWLARHRRMCGGTFTKVKEPENYSNNSKRKRKRCTTSDHTLGDEDGRQEQQPCKQRRVADNK